MKKVNLYIGLNDKNTKKQEINTVEAYKIVQNMVVKLFGGGTIYEVYGFYTHENGDIVEEKSLKLELVEPDNSKIIEFCTFAKMALNQESILKTEEIVSSSYL